MLKEALEKFNVENSREPNEEEMKGKSLIFIIKTQEFFFGLTIFGLPNKKMFFYRY